MNSFKYMDFQGPIRLRDAEQTFTIFTEYNDPKSRSGEFKKIYLGRWLASSQRHILDKYTLKKRTYINTTSMDSELAFLTANITLARENALFYDPFVGTGSFSIACAHFGAHVLGSDIDGRMIRGKPGMNNNILSNFRQYSLSDRHVDDFIADLTNSPLRQTMTTSRSGSRYLDGIICDPPYGVREGLKVLGVKDPSEGVNGKEPHLIDGVLAHLQEGYIPPKRAYGLEAMLDDILAFAVSTLVDGGRVSLWMPSANDKDVEFEVPLHPALELVSVCVQVFNKWSRRLLTYRRLADVDVDVDGNMVEVGTKREKAKTRATADELNSFRRRYFQGFRDEQQEKGNDGQGESTRLP